MIGRLASLARRPAARSITDGAGRELATCGRGNCFGELALLNNEARWGRCRPLLPLPPPVRWLLLLVCAGSPACQSHPMSLRPAREPPCCPRLLYCVCVCRAATVQAATAAKALACTRADFDTHLGSLAEIRNMWRFEALRKASRAAAAAPRGVAAAGGSLRACHVAAAMATVHG